MEFRLLGPVEAVQAGERVDLGRRRERSLLGLLLLEAGRPVSIDRLLGLLWDDEPPATARASLHSNMARLRARLAPHGVAVSTRGTSYLAEVHPLDVDVHRFREKVRKARELSLPDKRSALLSEALGLWQGPLLADAADDRLRDRIGAELAELRLTAIELFAEAELACGRHDQLISDLTGHLRQHPTRERMIGLLMQALKQDGRQADALALYRTSRQRLIDEHGLEPGAQLRQLHEEILREDRIQLPPDEVATDQPDRSSASPPGPSMLPAELSDFVGRTDEITAMMEQLTGDPEAVRVVVVSGLPGSGKTSLALRVAHRLRGRATGGQFYVDLRGHGDPLDPAQVLARFLRALGVNGAAIPEDADERAGMFRAALADRPVLLLLDNAADVTQVRPLLPGTSAMVLVTSRNHLVDLDGAHHIRLQTLEPGEAIALLSNVVGSARVAADRTSAAAIIAHCGLLPLAVRIAAAELAANPDWPLVRVAHNLADLAGRLDHLDRADRSIRAVLDSAYRLQAEPAQRLLRRLGLLDPGDFPGWLVGVLVADSQANTDADQALAKLCDASLVQQMAVDEAGQQRYRLHDLVKSFAREQGLAEETPAQQVEVLSAVCASWLTIVEQADDALFGTQMPFTRVALELARRPAPIDLHVRDAHSWFTAEHAFLRSLIGQVAATPQLLDYAWAIAWNCEYYQRLDDHMDDLVACVEQGLSAAQRSQAPEGLATMLLTMAFAEDNFDHLGEALRLARSALAAVEKTDNVWLQGEVWGILAMIHYGRNELEARRHTLRQSVDCFRAAGDLSSMAQKLINLAELADVTGDPAAEQLFVEAIRVLREAALDRPLAQGLRKQAAWQAAHGSLETARELYVEALSIVRTLRDRIGECVMLCEIGILLAGHGLIEEAAPYIADGNRLAAEFDSQRYPAFARYAEGRLALRRGQHGIARELIEPTIEALSPSPLWQLPALLDLAEAYGDDTKSAQRTLEQAIVVAEGLGATDQVAQVRSRLAALPAGD